jgi:hypothetical protein
MTTQDLRLSNAKPVHAHPYKYCHGCDQMKPPERGVHINNKWHCAVCSAPILRRLR